MWHPRSHPWSSILSGPAMPLTSKAAVRRWPVLSMLGVALLAVLALAGCGGSTTNSSQPSGPKTGGTLVVGLNADATTLDPLKSSSLYDREVYFNIYEPLVQTDASNNIQPDLATSWTYNTPTQLVFTLRTGVQFQDGTPFNAAAVVTNINRILTTKSSPRNSELATVASVQAVDDTHVQFNLSKPFSPLLATLSDRAGMILSPAVLASGADIANAPVNAGTGPFEFVSWVKGSELQVKKNPHYWQKDSAGRALPYLDGVTYKPITNGGVMFTNLQTSTIQVSQGVDPTDVKSVQSNPALVYKQIPALGFNGFELNTKSPPLNNVHVRRAISFAIDRQEILTSVLLNNGVLAQGPIPPSSFAYSASVAPFSHDINQAKAELAMANMSSATFTLLITSGSPLNSQEAQFIQSELQPAGITVNIKQETFSTILADTDAENYQAALVGWSGRVDPDGNTYAWFHTGGGFNQMQYSNTQVDALLADARAQSDQGKRATDYQQAETQILQDAPYVFIDYGLSVQETTKNVQNFPLLPTGMMPFAQTWLS
jgi:peptide/nickel transport system substrate-binding protein